MQSTIEVCEGAKSSLEFYLLLLGEYSMTEIVVTIEHIHKNIIMKDSTF